jgi:endo-beta-N-acetylglucosaminidase D
VVKPQSICGKTVDPTDLTTGSIVQLKGLIKTRNEENAKLYANNKETNITTTFRYGIRNDREVKVYLEMEITH